MVGVVQCGGCPMHDTKTTTAKQAPPLNGDGASLIDHPAAAIPGGGDPIGERQPTSNRSEPGLADFLEELKQTNKERTAAAEAKAPVKVLPFAQLEAKPLEWLWPGWIPRGALTLVDGDPGVSKSTLLLDVAARVTTGKPMPECGGKPGETGKVLIINVEDDPRRVLKPRLRAARADLERVIVPLDESGQSCWCPTLPDDLGQIEALIREHNVQLVILDPLSAFFSGKTDTHKDASVRSVLSKLSAVATATGAAIVVVRHLNKLIGGPAMYRGGGSIGIIGGARAAFLVAKDPDDADARLMAMVKSNWGQLPTALRYRINRVRLQVDQFKGRAIYATQFEKAPGVYANALVKPPDGGESKLDTAVQLLRDWLQDGSRPQKEIRKLAKQAGISWPTIRRAKPDAGAVSRKEGDGWVWALEPAAKPGGPEEARSGGGAGVPAAGTVTDPLDPLDPQRSVGVAGA